MSPELPDIGSEHMPPAKRPRRAENEQGPPQTRAAFPGFATQRPSATVTSGAYQALTEAAEESFSEPSYVVVNQPEKQFPAIGGVLAETSLNSTGSSGANTSFGSPQAMNLLQDQLKAVRLNNGTSLTHTLIQ